MKRLKKGIVTLTALVLAGYSYLAAPALADQKPKREHSSPPGIEKIIEERQPSRFSLEMVAGAYHAPIGIGPDHDDWEYTEAGLRLGMDITQKFETLVELSYAKTIKGWDDHVSGFLLWFRYNFDTDWRFKPYFQLGAGIVNNDIYKNTDQSVIGQGKEYYLKGGFGLFYDITDRSKLGAELLFAHLSNNGEAEYNDGSNGLGISIVYSIDLDFLKK